MVETVWNNFTWNPHSRWIHIVQEFQLFKLWSKIAKRYFSTSYTRVPKTATRSCLRYFTNFFSRVLVLFGSFHFWICQGIIHRFKKSAMTRFKSKPLCTVCKGQILYSWLCDYWINNNKKGHESEKNQILMSNPVS